MRRGLWFAVGASTGVYVSTKARRFAQSLTVEGLRHRVNGLAHGARLLGEEVRTAQQEKETELRRRMGLSQAGPDALPRGQGSSAPDLPPPTRLHHAGSARPTTTTGKNH